MTRPLRPLLESIAWLCLATTIALGQLPAPPDAQALRFFESKVRPVLVARCYECHGPESEAEGGLRLDSRAALLAGGTRGSALKPGDPQASLLVSAINHGEVVQMPPKTKMPAAEIADLTAWVMAGAPWPGDGQPTGPSTAAVATGSVTETDRQFWAFRPPAVSQPPSVNDHAWPSGALDHFVLAPLEARGLVPARPADRRTLIRRATFDLHGLPPTPAEVDAFMTDTSPEAFARVIDRLLGSPRYGERWGRIWLDLARYADSNGMDENMAMSEAWRYRDYVIGAFNRDLTYDQFVREQLAGDLLPPDDDATNFQRLTATGFLVLGPKMLAEDDPVKMEMDIIDEQLDTIGRTFLGLTLGCARCHDHKFDPIPTADYYALAGIFKSTKTMENHRVVAMWSERPLATRDAIAQAEAHQRDLSAATAEIQALETKANQAFRREARERTADYLLAAARRQQREQALAAQTAELAAGEIPGGAVLVEAERYARGNVVRDDTVYGAGIGVIYNAGPLPNFAEYDVSLPAAGTYQLAIRYAAAEPRGVVLSVDGRKVSPDAAALATGSWLPDTQTWSFEAILPLASGTHVVRLERDGPVPHVDKLALLPARFARDPATLGWQVVGQGSAETGLNPAVGRQWTDYLARVKDDTDSVFQPWLSWQRAAAEGQPLVAAGNDRFAATLWAAPRPATLADLAARYAHLCRAAEQSFVELNAGATKHDALPDPVQESFRRVFADPAGPLALPKNVKEYYPAATRESLTALQRRGDELEKSKPQLPHALVVAEQTPQDLEIHIRGNHLTKGPVVPRQFPRVLAGDAQSPIGADRSGRLELANWLARPDHPLTSRVMVNRIWQGHFGEGLVRSPDNFGKLGEQPDNQPLLDWLAQEFVAAGWSLKAMHRVIMLSSAYQMSTAFDARAAQLDPENRLLWRMNRRRLQVEQLRDAILAAGGPLDWTMGGTLLTNKNHTYVTSTASTNDVKYENPRRSVYLPVVRSALYDVFQAFDFADPSTMNGKRPSTTVAPQALFMMNSALVERQTRTMAEQLLAAQQADADRISDAYRRAYGRPASARETARALDFIARYEAEAAGTPAAERRLAAWQSLCRVILSANEFIYLE